MLVGVPNDLVAVLQATAQRIRGQGRDETVEGRGGKGGEKRMPSGEHDRHRCFAMSCMLSLHYSYYA